MRPICPKFPPFGTGWAPYSDDSTWKCHQRYNSRAYLGNFFGRRVAIKTKAKTMRFVAFPRFCFFFLNQTAQKNRCRRFRRFFRIRKPSCKGRCSQAAEVDVTALCRRCMFTRYDAVADRCVRLCAYKVHRYEVGPRDQRGPFGLTTMGGRYDGS